MGGNPLERNSNPNKTHTEWPSSFVDSAERGPNNTPLLRWTDLQPSSSLPSRQHTTPVQTSQVKWKKWKRSATLLPRSSNSCCCIRQNGIPLQFTATTREVQRGRKLQLQKKKVTNLSWHLVTLLCDRLCGSKAIPTVQRF